MKILTGRILMALLVVVILGFMIVTSVVNSNKGGGQYSHGLSGRPTVVVTGP